MNARIRMLITEDLSHISTDIKEISTLITKAIETAEDLQSANDRVSNLLIDKFPDVFLMSMEEYDGELIIKLDTNIIIH